MRVFNYDRSRHSAVKLRSTDPPDNCIGISVLSHRVKTGEQQPFPDTELAGIFRDANRSEEIFVGRIIARKADNLPLMQRDITGDRSPGERNVTLARPMFAELLPHP